MSEHVNVRMKLVKVTPEISAKIEKQLRRTKRRDARYKFWQAPPNPRYGSVLGNHYGGGHGPGEARLCQDCESRRHSNA